jgi:hypothetical protein
LKQLTKEAAYGVPVSGGDRHARNTASLRRLYTHELLAVYAAESKRMRDFIAAAETCERQLDGIVSALRVMTCDTRFCLLLVSEGLVTMPRLLVDRLQGAIREPQASCPAGTPPPDKGDNRALVGGICPEVFDVLRDLPVKSKIFTLLQNVLPVRQREIARLMVAMDRVRLTYARTFVALTPQSQLAKDFHPCTIANLTEAQRGEMAPELSRLGVAVLSVMDLRGRSGLELVAARCYFSRLMDNSRVVRHLARSFPGCFEGFHRLSTPAVNPLGSEPA